MPEADPARIAALNSALAESSDKALELGGPISGEHGVGPYKLRWLPLEQSAEVRGLQRGLKEPFVPLVFLNHGKAITGG